MGRHRELLLTSRPAGLPSPENWEVTEVETPALEDGQFAIAITDLSVDPAMRGWIEDRPSYMPPVSLGEVMRAGAVGRVLESRHPKYAAGDLVTGMLGAREVAISDGRGVGKVDTAMGAPGTWLGALGNTGLTAYFGLLEVGALKDRETVVVSAAAGAVGGVAGQIAKAKGCRVIGIAGGRQKCKHVVEQLGFDEAIDYKASDVGAELGRLLGADGIDVYFDNVGGEILDAVLTHLAFGARVVICGAISQYNAVDGWRGPANYWELLVKRARMEGFLVFDFAKKFGEAREDLAGWLADGSVVAREEVIEGGLEDFPTVLVRLFQGENTGKLILRLG